MEFISPDVVESVKVVVSNPLTFSVAITKLIKQLGVEHHGYLVAWCGISGAAATVGLTYFPDFWVQLCTLGVGLIGTGLFGATLDVSKAFGKKK